MPSEDDIVSARLRLRARYLDRIARTAALADQAPQGSGQPNRHGMPRLPVGQTETRKWPVLDLGRHPRIPKDAWLLTIDGAVAAPQSLTWAQLLELPQVEDASDFHCVTTWSKMDLTWRGVQFSTAIALAQPLPEATHVMLHSYDGYETNLPLEEALKDDVLLAHTVDGAPLPVEHGGPLRAVTPQLYAWKGAKWICRIELMRGDRPGFWEQRGYSMSAHPWRDDRYG